MTTSAIRRIEKRGSGAGGKNKAALAHSIPQASLSRAALLHCRARGSSSAPTGHASFDVVPAEFSFRWMRKGDTVLARLVERQQHLWVYNQTQAIAARMKELLPDVPVLV